MTSSRRAGEVARLSADRYSWITGNPEVIHVDENRLIGEVLSNIVCWLPSIRYGDYRDKWLALKLSVSELAMMRQLRLPPTYGGTSAYSVRNACIGSIRDALQAGTKQASAATTSSVAATAAKIAGSSGRVP